jgi:hypothetical protein
MRFLSALCDFLCCCFPCSHPPSSDDDEDLTPSESVNSLFISIISDEVLSSLFYKAWTRKQKDGLSMALEDPFWSDFSDRSYSEAVVKGRLPVLYRVSETGNVTFSVQLTIYL